MHFQILSLNSFYVFYLHSIHEHDTSTYSCGERRLTCVSALLEGPVLRRLHEYNMNLFSVLRLVIIHKNVSRESHATTSSLSQFIMLLNHFMVVFMHSEHFKQ